jgi:hypothetical protein
MRGVFAGVQLQEIAVTDYCLKRGNAGIGAKHADAIKAGFVGGICKPHRVDQRTES